MSSKNTVKDQLCQGSCIARNSSLDIRIQGSVGAEIALPGSTRALSLMTEVAGASTVHESRLRCAYRRVICPWGGKRKLPLSSLWKRVRFVKFGIPARLGRRPVSLLEWAIRASKLFGSCGRLPLSLLLLTMRYFNELLTKLGIGPTSLQSERNLQKHAAHKPVGFSDTTCNIVSLPMLYEVANNTSCMQTAAHEEHADGQVSQLP